MTISKNFISTFTKLTATKVHRELNLDKRFSMQTIKSSLTSCHRYLCRLWIFSKIPVDLKKLIKILYENVYPIKFFEKSIFRFLDKV